MASGIINFVCACGREHLVKVDISDDPARIKKSLFVPPSIEDVFNYCKKRDSPIDPGKFHAYYSSIGWKVGRNGMKNWKAAVVTWEKNIRENNNGR